MNQLNRKFKIFIDFDGTISTKDVGEAMFIQFGDKDENRRIISDWIDQKIDSAEMWQQLCGSIDCLNKNDFELFLKTISVDPGFKDFIDYCVENNHEVRILSDGFDLYIDKILTEKGFGSLEVFCNSAEIDTEGKIIPNFPFRDEECKRCANCKRNHIIEFSSDEDFTIYIGDGLTDTCPAQYADFIFAKDSLLRFCEMNRITYFPYKNFYEIKSKTIELEQKKRLKKRHQAELKRREIYIQG